MKFLKKQSFKEGIFSSTLLNIFAKGLQFLNTILIAYYFGASAGTDLYYFTIAIVLLISSLINNLDVVALIPEFIRLKENSGEKKAFGFLNLYIFLYAIIGLLILIVSFLSNNNALASFFNVSQQTIIDNALYIKLASILPLLMLITNLFSAISNAYNYFAVPVLINLINSVIVFLVILIFHYAMGPMAGIVAMLVGYSINIAILLYILLVKINWQFGAVHISLTKELRTTILVSYFTTIPITLRNYMTAYLFNGLGNGVLTAVNWGQQLAGLPDVFITTQVLNITSIKFSEYYAKQKIKDAYQLFYSIAGYLFIILFITAAISIIYASQIITLLMSRGSFDKDKAAITIVIFALLSALPFINLLPMLTGRLFIAFQLLKKTTFITTVSHIIITVILYVGIKYYGYWGFGVGSIIGYFIQSLLYVYITNKNFEGIRLIAIMYKIIKPILVFFTISVLLYFINTYLVSIQLSILSLLVGLFAYGAMLIKIYYVEILSTISNFKHKN